MLAIGIDSIGSVLVFAFCPFATVGVPWPIVLKTDYFTVRNYLGVLHLVFLSICVYFVMKRIVTVFLRNGGA